MSMNPETPVNTPAASPTMEAYREALFRAGIVARLHEGAQRGEGQTAVVARMVAEQQALAATITQPEFITLAAEALLKAQASINPNPRYHNTPAQAAEAMHQIMHRRAAEAKHFAQQLTQPEYLATLKGLTPAQARTAVPDLARVKMREVLSDLLHLENGKPQVIAHIDAAAKGAMLEHDALAMVFAPDGALHAALLKGLSQRLPEASPAMVEGIASEWLRARVQAAKVTSELSSNDGEAYREAVRQSTAWHRHAQARAANAVLPATVVQGAAATPALTFRERERQKTENQRAEDVAYTINHALSCGTTDVVLQPLIAATFGVNVGCDAGHHDHAHSHAKPKLTLKSFAHEAGHYFKGEIIGDFVAVPLTIAVQRLFPNFMHGLRTIFEPLLGWAFRGGANRTARHWGAEHGLAADDAQVKAHADAIYEHEVSHLPQAVVWNMFAYPIGAVAQKMGGHGRSYPEIFKSKLVGAVVSNGLLIGGRMIAPGAAQKWDAMTSDTIFLPASKTLGKVFGVDEEAIERAAKKNKAPHPAAWTKRVEGEPSQHASETVPTRG
jgi:hypothetical protein